MKKRYFVVFYKSFYPNAPFGYGNIGIVATAENNDTPFLSRKLVSEQISKADTQEGGSYIIIGFKELTKEEHSIFFDIEPIESEAQEV